jgi:hypothetical protein
MNTTNPISTRLAALAGLAASAVLAVGGILQLTDEQSSQTTVVGVEEHVILASLTATLLLLAPLTRYLGALAGRPRAATVAITGQLALAALTVISNVRGEDPSFFAAVAVPTNLMWFGGFVAIAIGLYRSGRVPRAIAIGLPLTWVAALPLSAVGGGLLAGAYFLVLGWLLAQGELPRRAAVATA